MYTDLSDVIELNTVPEWMKTAEDDVDIKYYFHILKTSCSLGKITQCCLQECCLQCLKSSCRFAFLIFITERSNFKMCQSFPQCQEYYSRGAMTLFFCLEQQKVVFFLV